MGGMRLGKLEEFKGRRCIFMKEIKDLWKKIDGDLSREREGKIGVRGGMALGGERKCEQEEGEMKKEGENVKKRAGQGGTGTPCQTSRSCL